MRNVDKEPIGISSTETLVEKLIGHEYDPLVTNAPLPNQTRWTAVSIGVLLGTLGAAPTLFDLIEPFFRR